VPESARKGDGEQAEGEQTMYQQQPERSGDPWEG
jgi:hypothetical protein